MFELYGPFAILIPVSLLAVLVALGFGLKALYSGGEDRSRSNKLMRLRVALQFVAILILVAFFYWRDRPGGLMVTLNRIYTRTGDKGKTRLSTGEPVTKDDLRVEAYGAVDETNAALGCARLHTGADGELDAMLSRIQNELFDLGADLATPDRGKPLAWEPLRILDSQVDRLEQEIDRLNAQMSALTSFVLRGGTPAAAHLHLACTIARRAERRAVTLSLQEGEAVSEAALKYLNRLSDFLFVAARYANEKGAGDVLWQPGATR